MKVVRSRYFATRLAPEVMGRIHCSPDQSFLVVSLKIKNIGNVKCGFNRQGPTLLVFALTAHDHDPPLTSALRTIGVFGEHDLVETGEEISHEALIPVDLTVPNLIGFKVLLRIVAKHWEWNVSTIVTIDKAPVEGKDV